MVRRQVEIMLVLIAALAAEWTFLMGARSPMAIAAGVFFAIAMTVLAADALRRDGRDQSATERTRQVQRQDPPANR